MRRARRCRIQSITAFGLLALMLCSCGSDGQDGKGSVDLRLVFPERHEMARSDRVGALALPAEIGYLRVQALSTPGEAPLGENDVDNPGDVNRIVVMVDVEEPTEVVFKAGAYTSAQSGSIYQGYVKARVDPTANNKVVIMMMPDQDGDEYVERHSSITDSDPAFPDPDCDQYNENIHPDNTNTLCDCEEPFPTGTLEICGDGIDQDCNGSDCQALCDPDPCAGITNAEADTCTEVEGNDFTCQCVTGYNWDDPSNSCTVSEPVGDINVSPASVPFGSVTVGESSAPFTVIVQNLGTGELTLSSATIVGSNTDDFVLDDSDCPAVLGPAVSCDLQVTFTPLAEGSREATLQIDSDDPDESTVPVGLTGQGGLVVLFPDDNLDLVIRAEIGKPTGDILASELLGLDVLNADSKNIIDIRGLEYCVELTELNLADNSISDLGPLAGLTSLTYLYLSYNNISNLGHLAGLSSLTVLYLDNNSISDLGPLAGMTSLIELYLSYNNISDLDPLAGMTSLTGLYLYSNSISDLGPLAGMTSLTELYIDDNSISNLGPLAGLTSLTDLYLYGNNISDLGPLAGMTSLIELNLDDNSISDITPLAGLTNLTYLYLTYNSISDITPLARNPGLDGGEYVDLRNNPLSSTSCIDHIPVLIARGVFVDHDCL